MKLCVAILLLSVGISCAFINGNGQPGCKTETELHVKYYRNYWDAAAYWICDELGIPAKIGRCPESNGWLDSQKRCVDWEDWIWEENTALPPSQP